MKTLDIIKRQNMERTHQAFSLKKKKFCKFTKAEHNFVVVIPKFLRSMNKYKNMTVEEFYDEYNNRDYGFRKDSDHYWLECSHCRKEDMIIKRKGL